MVKRYRWDKSSTRLGYCERRVILKAGGTRKFCWMGRGGGVELILILCFAWGKVLDVWKMSW